MLLNLIERPLEPRRRGRRDVSRQFWIRPGSLKTCRKNFMNDTVVANELQFSKPENQHLLYYVSLPI